MAKLMNTEYDPLVYNFLPDFSDAVVKFAAQKALDAINQLGPIFVKHNTYKEYGLIMVHRHFDMSTNEILVETMNHDRSKSVAIPWVLSEDKNALPLKTEVDKWDSYDLLQKKFILPQTWAFFDEATPGCLKPFEFLSSDIYHETTPSPDFVKDLYNELKKLKLENIFGLRYVWNQTSSYETSDENDRANVVQFGVTPPPSIQEKSVKVLFRINENGVESNKHSDWCAVHGGTCSHCGSHCSGHKK